MTNTTDIVESAAATPPSLSTLRLPQLQALAAELGVRGTARMRKSQLIEAIQAHQSGQPPHGAPAAPCHRPRSRRPPP